MTVPTPLASFFSSGNVTTSGAVTIGANVGVGDVILVGVVGGGTGQTFTVNDSAGHTYASSTAGDAASGTATTVQWWRVKATTAMTSGVGTITVTKGASGGLAFAALVLPSTYSATLYDNDTGSNTAAVNPVTVTAVDVVAGSVTLAIEGAAAARTVSSVGSGFTRTTEGAASGGGNPRSLGVAYAENASTTTGQVASWTLSASSAYAASAIVVQLGAMSVPVVTATETDTVVAFGRRKVRALATVTETGTVLPPGRVKSKALALGSETDATVSLARSKSRALTLAAETDTAITPGRRKVKALGVVGESDTAVSVSTPGDITVAITPATETDTAQGIGRRKQRTLAVVTETDAVVAVGRRKTRTVTPANQTDDAVIVGRTKRRAVTLAAETDTVVALTRSKRRTIATALEAGAVLVLGRVKRMAITLAAELDAAMTILTGPAVPDPDLDNPRVRVTSEATEVLITAVTSRTVITIGALMFVGDRLPILEVTIRAGTPLALVDFTTASAVRIVGVLDGVEIFDTTPTSATAAGVVTYAWQAADTDAPGLLQVYVVATFSGKERTFLAENPITIESRLS